MDFASKLLSDAKVAYPPRVNFDPEELAWWLHSFVQGTLLIARSKQEPKFIIANIRHCRAYLDHLFGGVSADKERIQGKERRPDNGNRADSCQA